MNENDKQNLIEMAKELNWQTQDKLRKAENPYINNREVFQIDPSKVTVWIKRYLSLGSIPYIISDDINEVLQAQIKLDTLWNWFFLLEKDAIGPFVWRPTLPIGNLKPTYFVIGDAPGEGKNVPLADGEFDRTLAYGPSSHLLRKSLIYAGIYFRSWYTNLCKLSIPNNRPSLMSEVHLHETYLRRELETLKPSHIILLGNHVEEYFDEVFCPSGVPPNNATLIKIYHPSYMSRKGYSPEKYGEMIKEKLNDRSNS